MPHSRRGAGAIAAGGGILVLLTALALAAPLLPTWDPLAVDLPGRLRPPSATHLLGQDALGRDVLARVIAGARLSLAVGAAVVALTLAVGVAVGAAAGYAGGRVDEALSRAIDVLLAFPGLLLAIFLAAVLGPGIDHAVLALAILGWTGYARLTRSQVAGLRRRDFVQAAEALGASPGRIVVWHVLPLAAPALIVQATFGLSGAVLAEASLSFLGLGAPPPTPSWGGMLNEGRSFLLVAPHLTVFPGLALAVTVLALQLLGDGLRDRLDVRDER